ncbi:MAG TPA: 16S rRNA (guanine(966)-N(2))-methyltransferase RsmD [Planctomycetota bacterium]|nr:16S rRNA (guanine(966)-N(2))-methyltransferase RsmD [Planctomycetota bacterium]
MRGPEGPRLTGGVAKGRRLFGVPGQDVRPALARMRISVFEILRPRLEGAVVVDLFAGTGSLGLEALSRGAARAVFYDLDHRSLQAVEKNLERLGFGDRGRVVQGNAFDAAERLEPADLVFVDPPYDFYVDRTAQMRSLIETLARRVLSTPEARVISEHRLKEGLGDVTGTRIVDERKYGDTVVTFYTRG